MGLLTVFVAVEISTLQVVPVAGVSRSKRCMFQPAVLVSFMEGERAAALILFSCTCLRTVSPTFSTEVPKISTPIIDVVLNT